MQVLINFHPLIIFSCNYDKRVISRGKIIDIIGRSGYHRQVPCFDSSRHINPEHRMSKLEA